VNLRAMQSLDRQFPVPVGYSDHTTAVETPALAVAAGARLVEKHFTLDRSLPGPDHEASLEPAELSRATSLATDAAVARGSPTKAPVEAELETRAVARKSLHATRSLDAGTRLDREAVAIQRPNDGLPPKDLERIIGSTLTEAVDPGTPIKEGMIDL
jgi:N,N'-diacetyllegionaminate synthase